MAKVLDWRRSEDPADFIHQAVQALTEGALVVVPTDTCYIALASGLRSQAVEALANFCGQPWSLAVGAKGLARTLDYPAR
jgi:tRNA A37 threonylcarbamoyladenosine synthetase subunit TsaC/SUA5/YrdC